VIPISYTGFSGKKNIPKKKRIVKEGPRKHVIHKAISWQKMLDDGEVESLSELAKKMGLTRARVTQIMNLLKLPAEMWEFLARLDDPKEIRRYSERRLRSMKKRIRFEE
jgi:ParB-like chromosome segregation protein Spo0J